MVGSCNPFLRFPAAPKSMSNNILLVWVGTTNLLWLLLTMEQWCAAKIYKSPIYYWIRHSNYTDSSQIPIMLPYYWIHFFSMHVINVSNESCAHKVTTKRVSDSKWIRILWKEHEEMEPCFIATGGLQWHHNVIGGKVSYR